MYAASPPTTTLAATAARLSIVATTGAQRIARPTRSKARCMARAPLHMDLRQIRSSGYVHLGLSCSTFEFRDSTVMLWMRMGDGCSR
jgi:hypothetical protein